ncbi:MAG TPA: sigma-70 family RNA polymerase sigma factor [Pseudonocardiaceae bacterium]|nr:sigma-70 family RNA polymerase sigma factor [Pseudonocardiaceae bacterium]
MTGNDWLADSFEQHRAHLRAVAYRMLGSAAEAEDAVQETWLRLSRTGADSVANLGGWLTTVVGRVCLDMLRSRTARREEPLDGHAPADTVVTPEQEALLADSVGLALLVVLDKLAPAERVAFVLHDLFDLPFDQIATVMGRTPNAARLLASRARRRVRGEPSVPAADLARQRAVVTAFFNASRAGDFDALLAVLDPDVTVRADAAATPVGRPMAIQGADTVVRYALAYATIAGDAQPALVDGAVGAVVASAKQPFAVMTFTVVADRITVIEIQADPEHVRELDLALLT